MKTEDFFILSISESPWSGCAVWWKPNNSGKTTNLNNAGVYTREQVENNKSYYDNGHWTRAVPCEDVLTLADTTVTVPNLPAMNRWKEASILC